MSAQPKLSFEEEERRDIAVRKLQMCFRSKLARMALKSLIRENYVKVYDKKKFQYFYMNRTTGETSMNKPKFLGNDDLPTPKVLAAPPDYDPQPLPDNFGCALVITNNRFRNERISEEGRALGKAAGTDNSQIGDKLSHEFIGKLRADNVIIAKNVNSFKFVDCFERLRKLCRAGSFVVIYICTHIIGAQTGLGGMLLGSNEDTYFCMEETNFKNTKTVAATSVSLGRVIQLINKLPCKQRTILLNYAHIEHPTTKLSERVLYPPQDMLFRLSDSTDSAVIGSCAIGMSLKEMIYHTPSYVAAKKASKKDKKEASSVSGKGTAQTAPIAEASPTENIPSRSLDAMLSASRSRITSTSAWIQDNISNIEETFRMTELRKNGSVKVEAMYATLEEYYRNLWGCPPDLPPVVTKKPMELSPTVLKDKSTNFKYEITLPTDAQKKSRRFQMLYYFYRRMVEPPMNIIRHGITYYRTHYMVAPFQTSYDDGAEHVHTVFGKALVDGIAGGACRENFPIVTVGMLFEYMSENVVNTAATLFDPVTKVARKQNIVLVIPKNHYRVIHNPVFARCGPPAYPECPFIVKYGVNEVTLQWYNSEFDGVQPWKYKIFLRNKTRCFHEWFPIDYTGVVRTTKFTIKSLPSGVICQFRVCAYNNGGWSTLSRESAPVCPGEELIPLPKGTRWRRLTLGGHLAVLDRLDAYPEHRLDVFIGIQKLVAFGSHGGGFHKGTAPMRIASCIANTLTKFPEDVELIDESYRSDILKILKEKGILGKLGRYGERFRTIGRIVSPLVLLHKELPQFVPELAGDINGGKKEKKLSRFGYEYSDSSEDESEPKAPAKPMGSPSDLRARKRITMIKEKKSTKVIPISQLRPERDSLYI